MMPAELLEAIGNIANEIVNDLGTGWKEAVYQKAMEVAFREQGIRYESQRIITVSYHDFNVGEGQIDLVPFIPWNMGRLFFVVDLDSTAGLKETDRTQVIKYIKELRRQVSSEDEVYDIGLKVNFCKKGENAKIKEGLVEQDGLQILQCNCQAEPSSME